MKYLLALFMLIATLPGFALAGNAFKLVNSEQKTTVVSENLFNRLYHDANEQQAISKSQFKQQLIDSLILSQYGQHNFAHLNQATNVGYDPKLTQAFQLNKVLTRWFAFDKTQAQQAAKKYMRFDLAKTQLQKTIGKPSILGYQLTEKQREKAESVIVATITLPHQANININLAELYQAQSVQGRMAFHQVQLASVKRYAYDHFYIHWHQYRSVAQTDFNSDDLTALKAIITAKYLEPLLMLELGAMTSEHGDNNGLSRFKPKVTKAQIEQFYRQHRQDYRHIIASKARLLHFPSKAAADRASKKLSSQNDWQQLASSMDQSGWFPQHKQGWVNVNNNSAQQNRFLTTLAMTLPENKLNPPIRGPQGHWYVVKVEQKKYDYFSADSQTVVYQATEAIAKKLAKKAFATLKLQLRQEVVISAHEAD